MLLGLNYGLGVCHQDRRHLVKFVDDCLDESWELGALHAARVGLQFKQEVVRLHRGLGCGVFRTNI